MTARMFVDPSQQLAMPPVPPMLPLPETADESAAAPVRVTIVLPCHNEGDHVRQEIERICAAMDASEYSYELLAVDDGSTDRTLEVLEKAELDFPALKVQAFRRNSGAGTVRRFGSQSAAGDIVVWTDADMSYPNERIPEFVRALDEDASIDQVVGARTTEEGTYKVLRASAKWVHRFCGECLHWNFVVPVAAVVDA
jgi:glycosyltransferase involved in cell wall biosynthesis